MVKLVVWLVTSGWFVVALLGIVVTGELFRVVTFWLEIDGLVVVVCFLLVVGVDETGGGVVVVVTVVAVVVI